MSSLITAVMTAGAMIGYWQVNPPRDDPYRGIQATELRRELERKIADAERRMVQRMMIIERTDQTIQTTQQEIWNVIRDLPPDTFENEVEGLANRIRSIEVWIIKKDQEYTPPD